MRTHFTADTLWVHVGDITERIAGCVTTMQVREILAGMADPSVDPADETEGLRAEIAALQAEPESLRARINALYAEIAALRAELDRKPAAPVAQAPGVVEASPPTPAAPVEIAAPKPARRRK